jgi:hypothetical protein
MRWRHDPDRTRIVRRRCQYGIGAVVATPGTYRALPARLLALARKGPEARHAAPVAASETPGTTKCVGTAPEVRLKRDPANPGLLKRA